MQEIYYPDGSVGVVSADRLKNPEINVVNPREGGRKFSSKHSLLATIDGEQLKIDVGLLAIKESSVIETPKRVMKDASGKEVKYVDYVKATGELLPAGTKGKKYVNSEGKEIASGDIHFYVETTEGEAKEVVPFTQTEDIKLTTKPISDVMDYVYSDQYEVVPDSDKAHWELWKLAEHLHKTNTVAVGIVVPRKGWEKYGVVLEAHVDEANGTFHVIAKFTQRKLVVEQPQTIPKGKPAPKKGEEIKTGVEEIFG